MVELVEEQKLKSAISKKFIKAKNILGVMNSFKMSESGPSLIESPVKMR